MRKGRINGGRQTGDSSDHCTCSSGQKDHFCKRCRQTICKYCTSTSHTYHDYLSIDEAATEIRNEIHEYNPAEKTAGKKDSVLNVQQLIQSMKTDLSALEANKIREIDLRLDELHKELLKIRADIVGKIQDDVKKESDNLNRAETLLSKTARSITALCDAATKLIDEQNSFVLVNDGYTICEEIDEVLKTDLMIPETDALSIEFYPGTTDSDSLQTMFGTISIQSNRKTSGGGLQKLAAVSTQKGFEHQQKQSAESDVTSVRQLPTTLVKGASGGAASRMAGITRVSGFRVDCNVWNITCTADDMCWYGGDSNDIRLVDRTGREVRRQTLPDWCYGLTTSQDRTVYISCINNSLYKLTTDDTMTDVKTCLTFTPVGLTCLPDTGELLVCGGTDGVFSVTGRGVHPALTDIKFGRTCDIAVNDRGDICVSDFLQEKVFIFDSHRRHVCTYTGHADMTQTMAPRGVTCDGRGGFIIADCDNKMLHVISRDGDNVMVYNTGRDCDGVPGFLDMSQSARLWVGFYVDKKVGHICVYDTT